MTREMKTPGRLRGAGADETAWTRRKCSEIRGQNEVADERGVRLDLLRSLKIPLPPVARERLLQLVRDLAREGHIPKGQARELRALFGAPDYA